MARKKKSQVGLKPLGLYLITLAIAFFLSGTTLYLMNRPDPTLSATMMEGMAHLPLMYDRGFRYDLGVGLVVIAGVLLVAGVVFVLITKKTV